MTWIDAIITNLKALVTLLSPVRVIRSYQRGVVFRKGIPHRVMQPGWNWCWPLMFEVVEAVGVNEETRNLLSQSVTTSDDVSATFSVNLVFIITDATKYYTEVYSFEQSIDAVAMTHLHKRARALTWAELRSDEQLTKLEASLKGTLTTRVQKWGAEIVSVGFTDMVRTRQFRLFGDPGESMRNRFVQA